MLSGVYYYWRKGGIVMAGMHLIVGQFDQGWQQQPYGTVADPYLKFETEFVVFSHENNDKQEPDFSEADDDTKQLTTRNPKKHVKWTDDISNGLSNELGEFAEL